MKDLASGVLISVGVLSLIGCSHPNLSSSGKTAASAERDSQGGQTRGESLKNQRAEAAWSQRMHQLSRTLGELYPILINEKKFAAPENKARARKLVSNLKELSHKLKPQSTTHPDQDPTLRIMAREFGDEISRIDEALAGGHYQYARRELLHVTSYCIECHTRSTIGPEFPQLDLGGHENTLPLLERAQLFLATRQYDKALATYQEYLGQKVKSTADLLEWEKAARDAIIVAVRVKKDPQLAASLVEKWRTSPNATVYFRRQMTQWGRELKEWQKEKPDQKLSPLERGEKLVTRAEKKGAGPNGSWQDITYLRASALLHEYLTEQRPAAEKARALYLLGISYENVRDPHLWNLHESFFDNCIRELPHSAQSLECFGRLNESVTTGYTGSGGVFIPETVSKRLTELKLLAEPSMTSP